MQCVYMYVGDTCIGDDHYHTMVAFTTMVYHYDMCLFHRSLVKLCLMMRYLRYERD